MENVEIFLRKEIGKFSDLMLHDCRIKFIRCKSFLILIRLGYNGYFPSKNVKFSCLSKKKGIKLSFVKKRLSPKTHLSQI
jgi:hypothetical protein